MSQALRGKISSKHVANRAGARDDPPGRVRERTADRLGNRGPTAGTPRPATGSPRPATRTIGPAAGITGSSAGNSPTGALAAAIAHPPAGTRTAGQVPATGGTPSPTVVPCGQPHDAEVYARFALAGRSWPGGAAIGTYARQGCTARLGSYLNPQLATTVLAESYVFPDQGAWNAGERAVICEIRSTTGKLTGSVRGLS